MVYIAGSDRVVLHVVWSSRFPESSPGGAVVRWKKLESTPPTRAEGAEWREGGGREGLLALLIPIPDPRGGTGPLERRDP